MWFSSRNSSSLDAAASLCVCVLNSPKNDCCHRVPFARLLWSTKHIQAFARTNPSPISHCTNEPKRRPFHRRGCSGIDFDKQLIHYGRELYKFSNAAQYIAKKYYMAGSLNLNTIIIGVYDNNKKSESGCLQLYSSCCRCPVILYPPIRLSGG